MHKQRIREDPGSSALFAVAAALAIKDGRTVVSTIHQPNSDIFEMFDRLMLLARGKIIYFNLASEAVEYFGSINF